MSRTQRLEAALRGLLEVCACESGCAPDDMTCATNAARAALADTSPSCCEEVRRAAREEMLTEEFCENPDCEKPLGRDDDEGKGLPRPWFCVECWNKGIKHAEDFGEAHGRESERLEFCVVVKALADARAKLADREKRIRLAHKKLKPLADDDDVYLVNVAMAVLDLHRPLSRRIKGTKTP